MANETRQLAAFARDLGHDDIPAHVRALAIDILVDQIGCQFGGGDLPWSKQVLETCSRPGGAPEATVIRYGHRLPLAAASFINSTFGHAFEYDDGNPFFQGHPGVELIPPLLAVAERDHLSGRDFLTAFITAYEVRGRIGWSVSPEMSMHGGPQFSTACGLFGAAAGVARLLGMSASGIEHALGIAGSYSGGLMQYDQGGGSVKRIHGAICASHGIQAAELAQAGMTGPEGILEGTRGLLRIYCPVFRPERLVADFGRMWTIERAMFKPYSCCGVVHSAIDGLRKIVAEHGLKAADIESIKVGYTKRCVHHCAVTAPRDVLGMQFSSSYSLAITLLTGRNTPREYTDEMLHNPEVHALAKRVQLYEDDDLTRLYVTQVPARTEVRAKSGAVYQELVVDSRGTAGTPLTHAEIDDKFRVQVEGVIGAANCDTALDMLRNIETVDDVAQLFTVLVQAREAS
jgi:2-methylcitrate dehydratase PrpD